MEIKRDRYRHLQVDDLSLGVKDNHVHVAMELISEFDVMRFEDASLEDNQQFPDSWTPMMVLEWDWVNKIVLFDD